MSGVNTYVQNIPDGGAPSNSKGVWLTEEKRVLRELPTCSVAFCSEQTKWNTTHHLYRGVQLRDLLLELRDVHVMLLVERLVLRRVVLLEGL